jgi:hypothetical protein
MLVVRKPQSLFMGSMDVLTLYFTVVTNAIVQQLGITEQQYEKWVELEMADVSVPLRCHK